MTVVIATRDRGAELLATLGRLRRLPERPDVVVVDNDSGDGTPRRVAADFPEVTVVALPANMGAAARNVGLRWARTPLVAFSDDDSWWDAGALRAAAARFAADPAIGLLAAAIVVEPGGQPDPTSVTMARGTLDEWLRPSPDGGRGVTGFLACGVVVRRRAMAAVGGFEPHLLIGGEEELAALDLAWPGWKTVYDPAVVARHQPSPSRQIAARRRLLARNRVLTGWLRYPPAVAARRTLPAGGLTSLQGTAWALGSAPWAAARRRPVPAWLADAFTTRSGGPPTGRGRRRAGPGRPPPAP